MRKIGRVLPGVLVIVLFGVLASAGEGGRVLELRGAFVKLVEERVGERECIGVIVKPLESDEQHVILTPREPSDLGSLVRRLRPGMRVEVGYVRDGDRNWLRRLDAEWRQEGDGERREERVVVRVEGEGREADRQVEREVVRPRADSQEPRREIQRDVEIIRVSDRAEVGRREVPREEMREGPPREGLAAHIGRLAQQFRDLAAQVARMEREIQALRTENERLRRMLGERGVRLEREPRREGDRPTEDRVRGERDTERTRVEGGDSPPVREREGDRERPAAREGDRGRPVVRDRGREGGVDREALPRLPDSLSGFQGVLRGELVRKLDRGFVMRLGRVVQVWEGNRARNPQEAVGKLLVLMIRAEGAGRQFMRTLGELEIGQGVLAEVFHMEGEHLTVVEQLRAAE